jgi:hypothetical protein
MLVDDTGNMLERDDNCIALPLWRMEVVLYFEYCIIIFPEL